MNKNNQLPTPDQYQQTRLVSTDANTADLLDRFAKLAVDAGMFVYRLPDKPALIAKLNELLTELALQKLLISNDPLLNDLGIVEALKTNHKIELLNWSNDSDSLITTSFDADAGITVPAMAIAETGSLVLQPSTSQPRLLSLAPPIHISILPADRLTADLLDVNLGSSITLVTGPSKTADIEMNLITGIHGPTEEHILIIQ